MNALTTDEIDYLNRFAHEDLVKLGTKLDELVTAYGAISSQAAPVNGVKAGKALNVTGVVVDGETVSINNPHLSENDVYEFVADAAKTVTLINSIPVDIEAHTTHSHDTLTIAAQPTSGDVMTIGDVEYTFVDDGDDDADGEISVGTTLASAKLAIVAAINGTDDHNTPNPKVSASAFNANVCTLTALVGGTVGDSIGTVGTFDDSSDNKFSAANLGSGADCSAQNAITALVTAITLDDTQGVGAVDSTGGVVTLTADVAGADGNDIVIGETMAHGAFAGAATKLTGGVDGTVGLLHEMRSDGDYIYVCIAPNTTADANWRRFDIGTAY